MKIVAVLLAALLLLGACKPSHRPGTIPGRDTQTSGPIEDFEPGEPR